jgi:uncharacterized membrane protein
VGGELQGRPNAAHYLLVLLGIVGGLVGYILVRDRDPQMGRHLIAIGSVVTALGLVTVATFTVGLADGVASWSPRWGRSVS